jgi:diaminopimelate epimerase
MRIFNSDGKEAGSCGNGLRCLARFIADLGMAEKLYRIQVEDQIVSVDFVGSQIEVDMGVAREMKLHVETDRGTVHFVNTGVPHTVQFCEEIEEIDIPLWAPYFRHHSLFGASGANVNAASLQPDGSIRVRTFERGIEGETLACGTGACAVAFLARELYSLEGPIPIHFAGGTLEIRVHQNRIYMLGPAEKVFSGTIQIK